MLDDISFRVEAGTDHGDHRQHRLRQDDAGRTSWRDCSTPPQGAVLVDGVDVRQLDPDLLWGKVGYVPQKAYLFSGTVASNLRFGRPDATDDELWEALDIAQAAGFVQAMPDGLDSEITQGGTNVSGGQRQRLSIARALVVRARDLRVRRLVLGARPRHRCPAARRAGTAHRPTPPCCIVAQRVSTIADADQILVLDDGELVGHRHPRRAASPTARPTPRSSRPNCGEGAVA